ncbi:hypothetical protein BKA65DRAFT_498996 [Rhexocercosporidium sp. MPI-PUGE-AT-0058]|nr:hypothetical protein BKA65DRAFT_498996 [Rhexocercosporidium sp. MPI-PUGE-AT-0058]
MLRLRLLRKAVCLPGWMSAVSQSLCHISSGGGILPVLLPLNFLFTNGLLTIDGAQYHGAWNLKPAKLTIQRQLELQLQLRSRTLFSFKYRYVWARNVVEACCRQAGWRAGGRVSGG